MVTVMEWTIITLLGEEVVRSDRTLKHHPTASIGLPLVQLPLTMHPPRRLVRLSRRDARLSNISKRRRPFLHPHSCPHLRSSLRTMLTLHQLVLLPHSLLTISTTISHIPNPHITDQLLDHTTPIDPTEVFRVHRQLVRRLLDIPMNRSLLPISIPH
jgi:hypothetical protein